jgi:SAM-dependent methyltransferase
MSVNAAIQYDAIARDYQRTRSTPLRQHIEAWTLWQLLGSADRLDVLDAGCGEGHYARQLKSRGAARVLGVDVSPAMIALAAEAESQQPLGIEYRCAPAESLDLPASFDVVLAAYLLHYATDAAMLATLCRRLGACLRPRGRLLALVENPEQSAADYAGYERYGFGKHAAQPRCEGSRITYTMVSGRELISFDTWYYGRATYERLLADAGFGNIRWHRPQLDPAAGDPAHWQAYLDNPPVLALTASAGIAP